MVFLIAKTMPNTPGIMNFLNTYGLNWQREDENKSIDPEEIIELAGRVCYMSFGSKQGRVGKSYLENIIGIKREGPAHGSVLEHLNYTFLITECSRGFTHEQVRHRAGWAYSQMSTRYIDYSLESESSDGDWQLSFCIHPELVGQNRLDVINHIKDMRRLYTKISENLMPEYSHLDNTSAKKAVRGVARSILPICTESVIVMTGNARAIWNAMALRGNKYADREIRGVYIDILKIMQQELPNIFGLIELKETNDGTEIILPREKL
jgi:thymidylate synthase (FAD)